MTRILALLIASLIAASCAASVRSNINVSHNLPATGSAKTVAIVPYDPQLAAAPDFAANAAKLAAHLQAKGYTVVPMSAGQTADYIAFFYYGVDRGTPVNLIQSVRHPVTGSIITYGVRSMYSQATDRIYKRAVSLDILDRTKYQPNVPTSFGASRVYTASMTSEGSCSAMDEVIDPMLMALFQDFPGQTGVFRIDVPLDAPCGLERFG